MKDPSLHEPSKKVLQMKTWSCFDETSMKAHRRAKAQQAYPASKQAQVHGRRPAGSVQIQSPSKAHEIMQRIRAHLSPT